MPIASEPVFFESAAEFRAWLEVHAATASELIVGFHAVASGRPSLRWSDAVDEALCFGWIDGIVRRIDTNSYTRRFTPRKPGSTWSKVNLAKVERLRAEGRMTAAGEAAYAQRTAERSGIYAYEQPDHAELSAAELRDFKRQRAACAYCEATPPSYRKVILHWITSAKRPATRATRLATLVAACAEGRRLR